MFKLSSVLFVILNNASSAPPLSPCFPVGFAVSLFSLGFIEIFSQLLLSSRLSQGLTILTGTDDFLREGLYDKISNDINELSKFHKDVFSIDTIIESKKMWAYCRAN